MHHIINNLWLGSQEDADKLVRHNPEKISAILNVRGPDAYYPPGRDQSGEHRGKAYKWIATPDTGVIARDHLREALAWLKERTEKHENILLHCKHGISRSPGFLAAFMVQSGISASLEDAIATIRLHRNVQPAVQMMEHVSRVVLISAVTGLPNRTAFEQGEKSAFTAIVDVELMKVFNDHYGQIAGDLLLRRLGRILVSVGLDAYHERGDELLCKGKSREELTQKLSRAREIFRESFQIYADGRIRTIEGTDFSFGVGTTEDEQKAALGEARKAKAGAESPEWLRQIIASAGAGEPW